MEWRKGELKKKKRYWVGPIPTKKVH